MINMVMLDAKEILNFIARKWDLDNPSVRTECITNGGFEDGLADWSSGGTVSIENTNPIPYEEDYYCRLTSPAEGLISYISQEFTQIGVGSLLSCGYYHYTEDLKWEYVDLLEYLDKKRLVKKITINVYGVYDECHFLTEIKEDVIITYDDDTIQTVTFTYDKTFTKINIDAIGILGVGELYLQLDEFNPNNPKYQMVFINRPARSFFVAPNVTKNEQSVTIELHVKLIKYDPITIDTLRTIFKNIKTEANRIFTVYRFGEVSTTLNMSSWIDSKLPHGYGEDKEPLELVSRLTLELVQYSATDNTIIGSRVHKITILGKDVLGLIDAQYIDTDPWVRIEIPKGPIVEQNLIGPHIIGEFSTHDYNSLHDILYNTEITENPDHYPINVDNSKTKFSTEPDNPEFIIVFKDVNGSEYIFNFFNVRIKQIELVKTPTSGLSEAIWKVLWIADFIYFVP